MKQSEKLDVILRSLYKYRDDGQYHSVKEILESHNIAITLEEIPRLAFRLRDDGFVDLIAAVPDDYLCQINSYGIEYCEGDSYTYKGSSLISNNYNLTISNSPQSSIVAGSQNVTITTYNLVEVEKKITEIKNALDADRSINQNRRNEILECLSEVEQAVKNGGSPKYSLRSLLSLTADITAVAQLVYSLGKAMGLTLP
jgi:hypothetical protein